MDTQLQAGTTLPWRQTIPVEKLFPSPDNPRKDLGDLRELEESIRVSGLQTPLIVIPRSEEATTFWVIDGERRYYAMAEWNTAIPCIVRPLAPGEKRGLRSILTSLVTASQRLDLSPIEKARAFGRLRDEFGLANTEIAAQCGLSAGTVGNFLELLELSPALQERVWKGPQDKRRNVIQVGEARQMVRRMRRAERKRKTGGNGRTGAVWEPLWFASTHPLARKAEARCDVMGHNARRRLGASGKSFAGACGQCWQAVTDEAAEARVLLRCADEVYAQDPALAGRWKNRAQAT